MATPQSNQLGVTPPLSTSLPTESENQASSDLIEELRRQNNYESKEDTEKRYSHTIHAAPPALGGVGVTLMLDRLLTSNAPGRTAVLTSLQSIVEAFVKKVYKKQGLSDAIANSAGGKVFTYGSFRLGVFGPGSDIDTLVVAPKQISRMDFFQYFPDLLLEMAPEGAITDVKPVQEAFVPIIKFEYSGISIDLIFSHLKQNSIPHTLLLNDSKLLLGLDETDLRSVNGTRVTDAILNLVPQKAIFRTALRGIKLWAQRRAIYANIMGFPGGVAWAMLVARVCQLYPKATSSTIILKFFRIMEKWQWPMPVLLKPIEEGPLNVRIWNPRVYKADSFHLMPIITPAYPSMCATHNITRSTKEIITRELKRGGNITDQIMLGKGQWKDLFVKHTFFTLGYKYYLQVISASTTKEAQSIWSGLVESKVRLLVVGLEGHESIALAHPFNKGFERFHSCNTEEEVEKAKTGSLEFQIRDIPVEALDRGGVKIDNGDVDVKPATEIGGVTNGVEQTTRIAEPTLVYTTTHYIGLEVREGAKSLDFSWQVNEFKHKCESWDKYDHDLNALSVAHIKNCDLPDDVFTDGEVKPAPSKKKKRRKLDDNDSPNLPKRQQTSVAAAG